MCYVLHVKDQTSDRSDRESFSLRTSDAARHDMNLIDPADGRCLFLPRGCDTVARVVERSEAGIGRLLSSTYVAFWKRYSGILRKVRW